MEVGVAHKRPLPLPRTYESLRGLEEVQTYTISMVGGVSPKSMGGSPREAQGGVVGSPTRGPHVSWTGGSKGVEGHGLGQMSGAQDPKPGRGSRKQASSGDRGREEVRDAAAPAQ